MSANPVRLFLSYARDDDELFVHRLHADLVGAGFKVWFDRVSMPARQLTFHQEIRDAIAACDRLVLVVGPNAGSSDYVTQEWQSALELRRCVNAIVRLDGKRADGDRIDGYDLIPEELKFVHAEDFRTDADYPGHLANLLRQLSEPVPRLGKLMAVPTLPAHYRAQPMALKELRDALLVDLRKPVVVTGAGAKVGVQGMGGIGKSVLSAALARDQQVRLAFPEGICWVDVGQQPDVVDLQRRLARLLGDPGLFDDVHAGRKTLRDQLADRRVLIILDNVWTRQPADALDVLGPRCKLLLTTRDAGLVTSLAGAGVQVQLPVEKEALALLAKAAGTPAESLPSEAREVVRECGRLPLALALCGGMVHAGSPWPDLLEALSEHDLQFLSNEHAPEEQHRTVWRAIEVSVLALPEEQRQRFAELAVFVAGVKVPEAAVVTLWLHTGAMAERAARRLLVEFKQRSLVQLERPAGEGGNTAAVASLHDLMHDFAVRLASRVGGPESSPHQGLLDAYRRKCANGWASGPDDGYFLEHLAHHLSEAGQDEELVRLVLDRRWLEAKTRAGLAFDLPGDIAAAAKAAPVADGRSRLLPLAEEALRRDIHFIARHAKDYPQALFQCLWNSCWWYDCDEAERHYARPEKGWPPGGPPWEQLEPTLRTLMEEWRAAVEQARPGLAWVRSLRPPPVPLGGSRQVVLAGHEDWVNSAAFSPDGARVVTAAQDKTGRVWDAARGLELAVLRGHEGAILSAVFDADGTRVVTASEDKTARVWDAATGTEIAIFRGHEGGVSRARFSRDGARVVTASGDRTARVWDAARGTELAVLRGHNDGVFSAELTRDGARVVTASGDRTTRVWDAVTGAPVAILRGHEDRLWSAALSPDGARVVTASEDRTARVWDASTGAEIAVLRGHEKWVTSAAFSPDGARIVTASADKTARLWDSATWAEVYVLRGHEDWVRIAAFSPDGTRIVTAVLVPQTVRVWDAVTGAEVNVLRGHEDWITSAAFSPDGSRIVTASLDRTARVWGVAAGAPPAALRGHEGLTDSVGFDHGGTRVVTTSADKTARVWDAATGTEIAVLRGHQDRPWSAAFDHAGVRVVTTSTDKTARIWDAATGAEIAILRGHQERVNSAAFSPDDSRVVTASEDKTARVWNAATGEEIAVLRGHEEPLRSAGFDDDGTRVVTVSTGNAIGTWDPAAGTCLEIVKGSTEAAAVPAGSRTHPWRIEATLLESQIQGQTDGAAVAWYPAVLGTVAAHPDGRRWAGISGHGYHFHLIALEGGPG